MSWVTIALTIFLTLLVVKAFEHIQKNYQIRKEYREFKKRLAFQVSLEAPYCNPEIYSHPLNEEEKVFGVIIKPGTELRESDVYDSTTGKWSEAGKNLIGLTHEHNPFVTWVRPVS